MIRQPMTEKRKNDALNCMMKIWVLAEMIKQEHSSDMDVRFTKPELNRFASRVQQDAEAIHKELSSGTNFRVRSKPGDAVENTAGQMFRVFNYFIRLGCEQIAKFMDNVDAIKEGAVSPEEKCISALINLLDFPAADLQTWSLGSQPITITINPKHLKDAIEAIETFKKSNSQ